MKLTEKQFEGLTIALDRYKRGEKYTIITGFAGSGKSTLVQFIIDALPINKHLVAYAAYTGKACAVLRAKGNDNVITLHKLLYNYKIDNDGNYIRTPKKELEYKLVIVDECSMISAEMVAALLKYDVYVIFLGDPFQLPSIDEKDNEICEHSHIFLDEIMRQALDNEIIKYSLDIRQNNPIPEFYQGKNVQIYPNNQLTDGMLKWADQIICSTNSKRIEINNHMRELLGYKGKPQIGDKIICLRNDWDKLDDNGDALINGTIGTLKEIKSGFYRVPAYLKIPDNKIPYYKISFETDTGSYFNDLIVDRQLFEGSEKPYLTDTQKILMMRNPYLQKKHIIPPHEFTYGYAITAYKAQGSSWKKVLVIEEYYPFDVKEHKKWLYTSLTRSEDKVVWIKK